MHERILIQSLLENGDYRINIKIIDNFYNKGKQILKDKSI